MLLMHTTSITCNYQTTERCSTDGLIACETNVQQERKSVEEEEVWERDCHRQLVSSCWRCSGRLCDMIARSRRTLPATVPLLALSAPASVAQPPSSGSPIGHRCCTSRSFRAIDALAGAWVPASRCSYTAACSPLSGSYAGADGKPLTMCMVRKGGRSARSFDMHASASSR